MRLIVLMAVASMAGCAAKPVNLEADFDKTQAARLLARGSNVIAGSALLRQRGGAVVTCAGRPVLLIPATAYADEWARHEFEWIGGGPSAVGFRSEASVPVSYIHPADFVSQQRVVPCDARGMFRFEGVADGRFYVMTEILWMSGTVPQGGRLARAVTLAGGQQQELVLTVN